MQLCWWPPLYSNKRGLDRVFSSWKLGCSVTPRQKAKSCGGAPESSPFMFFLAGYMTDNLLNCTQTPEVMLAFVFLANFFLQISSDWIISAGMSLKTAFLSWELEVPQRPEGSQQSLPRELFKTDFYLTRELFLSLIPWWGEKQRLSWQAFLSCSEETVRKSWHRKFFQNIPRTMQKSIFVNCWLPVGGEGWGHTHTKSVEGKMKSFCCLIPWK